jgi:hypothetical protein
MRFKKAKRLFLINILYKVIISALIPALNIYNLLPGASKPIFIGEEKN